MKPIDKLDITRAPWAIVDACAGHIGVASVNGCRVADVDQLEDARLIAAAPDMYDVLYSLRPFLEWCANDPDNELLAKKAATKLAKVNKVLAKASVQKDRDRDKPNCCFIR